MKDTRARILAAAAELFRRHGYTGTGVKRVVADAHVPFGSLYHFFPGGKQQLGTEVVRVAGAAYGELVMDHLRGFSDRPAAIVDAFAQAALTLEHSDFADACPIATIALETANTDEPLRVATAEVFTVWVDDLVAWFTEGGIDPSRSRELALELLAALEGAFVLCRATRSTESLRVTGEALAAATRRALTASEPV